MAWRRSQERRPAAARGDPAAARAAAEALLARRDLATESLRARLCGAGFEADTVAGLIAELTSRGVVDDRRFAENYVTWHSDRGRGPIRIAGELRRLGLAPELLQGALSAVSDWSARAARARRAKFGPAAPQSWADRSRQARFLQYRGFSADHIRAAIGADFDLD